MYPRLIPFQFNVDDRAVLVFGDYILHVITGGVKTHTLNSPYSLEQVQHLGFKQSADTVYLTCHNVYPKKLMRSLDAGGNVIWTLANVEFNPLLSPPSDLTGSATRAGDEVTRKTYRYRVASIDDESGEESMASGRVEVESWLLSIAYEGRRQSEITLAWSPVSGIKRYAVYKERGGAYGWIGDAVSIDTDGKYYFIDDDIDPDLTLTPIDYVNYFDTLEAMPACVAFFQQRLCYANTWAEPTKIITSRSSQFDNFGKSTPVRDDDSVVLVIPNTEVNEIRALVPLRNHLIVFTAGEVHTISAGGESGVLTPDNQEREVSEYHGSAWLTPIELGDKILFIDRTQRMVWQMGYNLESDGYSNNDLTMRVAHIFEDRRIIDWALQRSPHQMIWCVLDDGTLACLTLNVGAGVIAWHRHDTQNGKFRAVCCLKNDEDDDADEVRFLVEREINGEAKMYLEKLGPFFQLNDTLSEARTVDCAMTWGGVPSDEITGLDHLDGHEVQVLLTDTEGRTYAFEDGYPQGEDLNSILVLGVEAETKPPEDEDEEPEPARAFTLNLSADNYPVMPLLLGEEDQPGGELKLFAIEDGAISWDGEHKALAVNAVVGLPIEALVETVPLQKMPGFKKGLNETIFRIKNGVGFELEKEQINPNGVLMQVLKERVKLRDRSQVFDRYGYFDPDIELFSGDIKSATPALTNRDGRFKLKAFEPYPLTILMIISKVNNGGM